MPPIPELAICVSVCVWVGVCGGGGYGRKWGCGGVSVWGGGGGGGGGASCVSACLSVCLVICLPACLSVCLIVCLSDCLSVCLSAALSVCVIPSRLTFTTNHIRERQFKTKSISRRGSKSSKIVTALKTGDNCRK